MIEPDADLKEAAARCAASAFANSGQVCISLQRLFVHQGVLKAFTQELLDVTAKLKVCDPVEKHCDVGPMISEGEAKRAESWVREAVKGGAGGLMVNDTSIFRVDHMPYGGNRMSGIGREGVRFAMEEMTNLRMVVIKPG